MQQQDELLSFGHKLSLAQRNVEAAQLNLDNAVEFMNQLVREFSQGSQSMMSLPPHPRANGHVNGYTNVQTALPMPDPIKPKKKTGRPRKDSLAALPPPDPDFTPADTVPNLKPVDGKTRIGGLFIYPYFIGEFVSHMKPGTNKFKAEEICEFVRRVLRYDPDINNMRQALSHQAGSGGPKTLKSYGYGNGYAVRPGGPLAQLAH